MHVVIDNNEEDYDEYKMWFDGCYDKRTSYRSRMMFREEELSGLNSQKDKGMKYFNYLVDSER